MSRSRSADRPPGSLLLELAICLPLMVLITLATFDACSMIHVRQSLKIAAFEAARVAVDPTVEHSPEELAQRILAARRVDAYTTRVDRSAAELHSGDEVTVSASAECVPNCLMKGWFYGGKSITESVTLVVP